LPTWPDRGNGRHDQQRLGPIGLLLALNFVFFLGLTGRSASRAASLQEEVQTSSRELSTVLKDLDKNDRKQALARLVDREYQDLCDHVLRRYSENFNNVRLELESIMKEVRVGAQTISYTKTDMPDFALIRNTISIPLKGDYHSLRKLLSLIEQSDQFLIVDSIQLTDSTNEGKELNLHIGLVAFFYEPEPEAASGKRNPT
jgi:hypothetical protein